MQQKEDYKRFQNREILKFYENEMTSREKQKIEKNFEKYISNNVYHSIYLKEGVTNILVAEKLCSFIRNTMPEILDGVRSFEEFIKPNN